jgi:hypothetical protein
MPTIEERYRAALAAIPAPGGGGCHAALLGVANLGIMAGRNDDVILSDIRAHVPAGRRKVADREILDAINRAHKDTAPMNANAPRPRPMPPPRRTYAEQVAAMLKDPKQAAALQSRIIEAGGGELDPEGVEVWEASPVRIEAYSERFPYAGDMLLLLEHLYQPDDVLFIGSRYDAGRENVQTAVDWLAFFRHALAWIEKQPVERQQGHFDRLGRKYPHIIPNTLTGQPGAVKSGDKQTLRGDTCVKSFRYTVAEFDELPILKQGAILRGLCSTGCRIAALIHSGGKSCHAWITCNGITCADDWARIVKTTVFPGLAALGVDKACSNPARLSRLPGVFRSDKASWQKLLYLAPGGGTL